MNYAKIKKHDIANGPGVRVSLYVSGCTHHCRNCFNPETWDFASGQPFDEAAEREILEALKPSYIRGLSLLGGEPFEPENQRGILPFLQKLKQEFPEKTVWAYTGFVLEDLMTEGTHPHCEITETILSLIDVLIDGRFVEAKKDLSLQFRGSSNQRIIDLNKTLAEGRVILWEDPSKTTEGTKI